MAGSKAQAQAPGSPATTPTASEVATTTAALQAAAPSSGGGFLHDLAIPLEILGTGVIDAGKAGKWLTVEAPKRVAQMLGIAQVSAADVPAILQKLGQLIADAESAIATDGLNFTMDNQVRLDIMALIACVKQYGGDLVKAVQG